MKKKSLHLVLYLEQHLYGEDAGESVVEVGEYVVALAPLLHGVLGRQRHAAQDDDHHDEGVKEGEGDDAVDEDADWVGRAQQEHGRVGQDRLLDEDVVVVRRATVAELHLAGKRKGK